VVPFVDYTGLLEELSGWYHAPGAFGLRVLAGNATLTNPVRVVLTLRTKRPGGDRSSGLLGGGDASDILVTEAGRDVLSEHPLEGNTRAALFLAAHQAFVDRRTGSGGTASPVGPVPAELGSGTYSSPLMVVIGAYLAAEDTIGTTRSIGPFWRCVLSRRKVLEPAGTGPCRRAPCRHNRRP